METDDDWLAPDKLEHILACFLITILIALACRLSRYPFLRNRSAVIGSLAAVFAGAAKEAGDEIGIWRSAGASTKDAVADLVGIVIADLFLALYQRLVAPSQREIDRDKGIGMV